MTSKLIHLIVLTLFIATSCGDDPGPQDQLPPVTQEGVNTFGCVLDGVVLIPKNARPDIGSGMGARGLQIVYRKDSLVSSKRPGYFSIQASNFLDVGGDLVYLYIPSLDQPGSFQINASNGHSGIDSPPHTHVFSNVYDQNDEAIRYLSYKQCGEVNITRFDTVNTIISGQFNLMIIDEDTPNDTIAITDGRFDINWSTLDQ